MRAFVVIFFALLLHVGVVSAQERVEVITLSYRTAEQMIPLIQPLVGKDGAVTGMQNKLIIRTSAANLAQIKQVIASLDSMPRKLMITVRQNTSRDALAQEARVYGSVGGPHARVTLPDTPGTAGGRIEAGNDRNTVGAKVNSTRDIADSRDTQRIQVLEGNTAYIQVGQSVPYRGHTVYRNAGGTTVVEDTSYRDVASGFAVVPRVTGDQVTLEINPQHNTLGPRGTVNVQQASSVVSGRIGEWIELGGVGQQATREGSGTVYSTQSASSDNRSIFVRVEEIK